MFDIKGLHRAEHFPVKPLVEPACMHAASVYIQTKLLLFSPAKYEEYIKSMKASHFLFSCQECDHHFKTKEQSREHVHKIHNRNEDVDHCEKKFETLG